MTDREIERAIEALEVKVWRAWWASWASEMARTAWGVMPPRRPDGYGERARFRELGRVAYEAEAREWCERICFGRAVELRAEGRDVDVDGTPVAEIEARAAAWRKANAR